MLLLVEVLDPIACRIIVPELGLVHLLVELRLFVPELSFENVHYDTVNTQRREGNGIEPTLVDGVRCGVELATASLEKSARHGGFEERKSKRGRREFDGGDVEAGGMKKWKEFGRLLRQTRQHWERQFTLSPPD